MKKRMNLKLLSILCVVVLVFLAMSTFAFSAKKEMVKEWIYADEGGSITLEDVTITFDSGILTKDTKIFVIYFGDDLVPSPPFFKVIENRNKNNPRTNLWLFLFYNQFN